MHVIATTEGWILTACRIFTPGERKPSKEAFTNGFGPAICVTAVLSLAGAIAGLALPGKRRARKTVLAHAVPALQASS